MTLLICILVFCSSLAVDFCHAQYVLAVERLSYAAPVWSALQWSAATVGFLIAIKVTLWALPFEVTGLLVGSFVAIYRRRQANIAEYRLTSTQLPSPQEEANLN